MNTSKIAIVGGIFILIGGLALATYTASSAGALKEAKAKAVSKYSNLAHKSLIQKNLDNALKFAKKALVVDAGNKEALETYKDVILASSGKMPSATKTQPSKAPKKPAIEADDEMGCI